MLKKDTKTRKIKKGVALCICPFVAEEKYKNTQNSKRVPCAVWASPHAYNKTQKIQKNKPKKYKNTSNTGLLQFLNGIKNTQNTWVV